VNEKPYHCSNRLAGSLPAVPINLSFYAILPHCKPVRRRNFVQIFLDLHTATAIIKMSSQAFFLLNRKTVNNFLGGGAMKNKSILISVITLFVTAWANADVLYNITDLGTFGGNYSYAYSINNTGQVAGQSADLYNVFRACLFDTQNHNNINLGSVPGQSASVASSINDLGQIVGNAGSQAVLFDPTGNGNNKDLGIGQAWSINNNGQIVGRLGLANIFDPTGNGNNISLGTLGGEWSEAYANNDLGQIVGVAARSGGLEHACLFDPSGLGNNIDLGSLWTGNSSYAYSINNHGLAVGVANVGKGESEWPHACLFDLNNGNTDLGTIGGKESVAWSINDSGVIVGRSYTELGVWHATLFDQTGLGNNIDLNAVISPVSNWLLETAYGVNNNGWIVGCGRNPEGYGTAYLLTPVPEPATLLLFGLGAVMLRRKR